MMNKSQVQLTSPQNKFLRHIVKILPQIRSSATAAATVVAIVVATVVVVVVTAAIVNEQQDDDDEEQPGAVCFAAEEITQTHIQLSPFPKTAGLGWQIRILSP